MTRREDKTPASPPGLQLSTGVVIVMLAPFVLAMGLLVVMPLGSLVVQSFSVGLDGYAAVLSDSQRVRVLTNTLLYSFVATAFCLLIGFTLAWSIRTVRSRWARGLYFVALLVPMWMSVTVKNYAWYIILGHQGLLRVVLQGLGIESESLLFTPVAVVVGLVYTLFPFATLPLLVSMMAIPDATLRAAETLGAGTLTLIGTIVAPLIWSAGLVTTIFVYVLCMGFYVTPVILGGPRATFIASLVQDDVFLRFDQISAATTSVILVTLAVLGIALTIGIVGRSRFGETLG